MRHRSPMKISTPFETMRPCRLAKRSVTAPCRNVLTPSSVVCCGITKLMEEARLPEPNHRLTEKPDYVPQWCSKHWLKPVNRKGGGKRRRAS